MRCGGINSEPHSTPTHFVYDLYFYLQDPNAPEALEFDINQSMNGTRYTWGTECSYRDTGYWDIWNPETLAWETTSVPCQPCSANTWHHLTWTVERVNGQAHYISVELDGDVHTVDKYYNPQQHYQGRWRECRVPDGWRLSPGPVLGLVGQR